MSQPGHISAQLRTIQPTALGLAWLAPRRSTPSPCLAPSALGGWWWLPPPLKLRFAWSTLSTSYLPSSWLALIYPSLCCPVRTPSGGFLKAQQRAGGWCLLWALPAPQLPPAWLIAHWFAICNDLSPCQTWDSGTVKRLSSWSGFGVRLLAGCPWAAHCLRASVFSCVK